MTLPVLVRELVWDPVAVVVPEEDTDTEALSDHSPLVDGCADPVQEAEGLKEPESDADHVATLGDAVDVVTPVEDAHAVCVAV